MVPWLRTLAALSEHQGLITSTPYGGFPLQFQGSEVLFWTQDTKHAYGALTYKKFRQKHPYTLIFFRKRKIRETD